MKTKRKNELSTIEDEQKDVLLLDQVLQGKWAGKYEGYSTEKVNLVIVYAEFDLVYKIVHSEFSEDRYLCDDGKRWLTQEEYLLLIKSLITGKGNALKNKVNSAFRVLYHIIDGVDLKNCEYNEVFPSRSPQIPKTKSKYDSFEYKIGLMFWSTDYKRSRKRRKDVIRKSYVNKENSKEIWFKYLVPITDYIGKHFVQKRTRLLEDAEEQHYKDLYDTYAGLVGQYVKDQDYQTAVFKIEDALNLLKHHDIDILADLEQSRFLKSLYKEASAILDMEDAEAADILFRRIAFVMPLIPHYAVDHIRCLFNCYIWDGSEKIPGVCDACFFKKKLPLAVEQG